MHKNVHKNKDLRFTCDVYQPRDSKGRFGKATVIRNRFASTLYNATRQVKSQGEIIHWSKEDSVFLPKSLINKLVRGA